MSLWENSSSTGPSSPDTKLCEHISYESCSLPSARRLVGIARLGETLFAAAEGSLASIRKALTIATACNLLSTSGLNPI
ncbi:unnamed protein product [Protopolystoma xenopodis]|uniref:Uncharacterized protein n=1 Tax=Protopolystoma xenopodis TaxID=117903 RepID=A0A448XNZ5_9PLAT|nr:unnamed protein product [Protopolystoma xenopodis]